MREGMTDSRRAAILEMAECYLWRSEVDRLGFESVLHVLEGLGWLDEVTIAHILDDVDIMYRAPGKNVDEAKPVHSTDNGALQ